MENKPPSAGDRGVSIGRDAIGNVIQTGDNNTATLQQVQLPPPNSVNIQAEVQALRELLTALTGATPSQQVKITSAITEAEAVLALPEPDRDEVGEAIDRALKNAQKVEGFAKVIDVVKPHVIPIAAWLGTNWDRILTVVGLRR
jgi:hypothetical protein